MEFTRLTLTIATPVLLAPIVMFCVNAQASGTVKHCTLAHTTWYGRSGLGSDKFLLLRK